MNMKKYKTKIFLTMILGLLSVCLFTGCSNNVESGKFVAISTEGIIAYSTDGINWTERRDQLELLTSPAQWFRICYGDGKFVATAFRGNDAAYSTDGEIWSPTTITSTSQWQSLTYGNGKFVAVSAEFGKIAAYSTNGSKWYPADFSPDVADAVWRGVCYGIGMFVAISEADETAYSPDGIHWKKGNPLESGLWTNVNVCYGKGKFVAMADNGNVEYSTNGINWTPVATGLAGTWRGFCYGNGKFVMVQGDSSGSNGVAYSTDGIHWGQTEIPITGKFWEHVCYGNGMFIAIDSDGQIAYSEDGEKWNIGAKLSPPPPSLPPHSWTGLVYGLDSDVFGFL